MCGSSSFENHETPKPPPTFAEIARKHRTAKRAFVKAQAKRDLYIRLQAETLVFEEKTAVLSTPLSGWDLEDAIRNYKGDARRRIDLKNNARKR